jgi:hypothetical protein
MGEERILGKRDGVPEGSFETEAEAEELASNIPGDMMGTAFRFVRKVWIP